MLITFQDGEAMITGEASDSDEVANRSSLRSRPLSSTPLAAVTVRRMVGRCAGHA
jgi:hypothetical protein